MENWNLSKSWEKKGIFASFFRALLETFPRPHYLLLSAPTSARKDWDEYWLELFELFISHEALRVTKLRSNSTWLRITSNKWIPVQFQAAWTSIIRLFLASS